MSLVSNVFILFVAGSVAIYYILPQKVQWCGLLVMSYIYYLAAGSKYILFLLFSTIVTYVSGRLIGSQIGKDKRKAKKFLIAGLILNFGMLGVVKYTNFILENMNLIFPWNETITSTWNIILYVSIVRILTGCILEKRYSRKESFSLCIVCILFPADSAGTDWTTQ